MHHESLVIAAPRRTPIGASGARILVSLLHVPRNRGGGKGIASLCVGGSETVAMSIEVPI